MVGALPQRWGCASCVCAVFAKFKGRGGVGNSPLGARAGGGRQAARASRARALPLKNFENDIGITHSSQIKKAGLGHPRKGAYQEGLDSAPPKMGESGK